MAPAPQHIDYPHGVQTLGSTGQARRSGGRAVVLPELTGVDPNPEWALALEGFELHLLSLDRSPGTGATRLSNALVLAKWGTKTGREPAQIDKTVMQGYLIRQYKGRQGNGALNLHASLAVFWSWFSTEYQVPNPMADIPRPKGGARPVPVLSPADIDKLLGACKSARDTAVVALLLGSGLRRAELCALDWSDIDLKARTVIVKRGKGGKSRVTVMDETAAQALWRWRRQQGPQSTDAVFTGRFGDRLQHSGCHQVLVRLGERAGIKVHPHMSFQAEDATSENRL